MSADDPAALRALGRQCRSLARGASTAAVSRTLDAMADGYERQAVTADAAQPIATPPNPVE